MEMALVAPILFMILLGTVDVGRYVADATLIEGALRAGMRAAQNDIPAADVGTAIRDNASTFLTNNNTTWGDAEALSGSNDCDVTATPAHACGDPEGCSTSPLSSFWTPASGPAPTACFAVGYCTLTTGPPATCNDPSSGNWTNWPNGTGMVVVRVVVKFDSWAPGLGNGSTFYVVREGVAEVLQ